MTKNKKIPKVIVIVEGGAVQDIIADSDIDVCLKDFDNIAVGERFTADFDYPIEIVNNKQEFEQRLFEGTINELV